MSAAGGDGRQSTPGRTSVDRSRRQTSTNSEMSGFLKKNPSSTEKTRTSSSAPRLSDRCVKYSSSEQTGVRTGWRTVCQRTRPLIVPQQSNHQTQLAPDLSAYIFSYFISFFLFMYLLHRLTHRCPPSHTHTHLHPLEDLSCRCTVITPKLQGHI